MSLIVWRRNQHLNQFVCISYWRLRPPTTLLPPVARRGVSRVACSVFAASLRHRVGVVSSLSSPLPVRVVGSVGAGAETLCRERLRISS